MKYIIPALLLSTFFFTACLDTPAPDEDTRVELQFEVENLGKEYIVDADTIVVSEFKFAMDRFILVDSDSVVLGSSSQIDTYIFSYNDEATQENLILSTLLGFDGINDFVSYEMFVEPVRNSDRLSDTEFLGNSNNYSIVMNGRVNSADFSFKSSTSINKKFQFPVIEIRGNNETLLIKKTVDMDNLLFTDDGATFVDPSEGTNTATIDSLFKLNINIEASAANLLN